MSLQEFAVWWDDTSDPKVATSARTLAEWKGDIEKLCSNQNICTAEVEEAVETFYAKIVAAQATAKRATGK